jgi:hypothetical protein
VIAFNTFRSKVKAATTGGETLARLLLSNLKAVDDGRGVE